MHAGELVELAAAVSIQGPALIHSRLRPPAAAVQRYWQGSRHRLDRWAMAIRQFTKEAESPGATARRCQARWQTIRSVCEEILTGEILARVFAAVVCAGDRSDDEGDLAASAVRSVFIGQLEANRQVLTLLLRGPGLDAQQVMLLDKLRRRSERWCDMLIGYLAAYVDVDEFAVDAQRARDFAEDLCHQNAAAGGAGAWMLVRVSMRRSFGADMAPLSFSAKLNEEIARGVMSCFNADQFDAIGKLRSLWMVRLRDATEEAQKMIDSLACDDEHGTIEKEFRLAGEAHLQRLRDFGCC